LAIDELVALVEKRGLFLSSDLTNFVYEATTAASPLRRWIRDHSLFSNPSEINSLETYQAEGYPFDLIKDILLEMFAINRKNLDAKIRKVYSYREL
jgi:hypothetical protein